MIKILLITIMCVVVNVQTGTYTVDPSGCVE